MGNALFGTEYVKLFFGIPEWYILSDRAEAKLQKYLCEAPTHKDARMYRFLDCSAFCDEQFCYFCATYYGDIRQLCAPCHGLPARD